MRLTLLLATAGALRAPVSRRHALFGGGAALVALPRAAPALVKGSAPPPRKKAGAATEKRTCRDIDECEALGEKRTAEQFGEEMPFSTTAEGVRWRDVAEGAGGDAVKRGDAVRFKYRVMRLGKRATDNLSGEASPVFSLGYGEDDDSEKDFLSARVGGGQLIPALDSAIVGMRPGGRRRLFVVPEKGWKKINSSCSAESNGASNAGDASAGLADIAGQAIVPLAQMVDNGACIEDALLPQPANFGAKRRLARRFDEGLLLEVEVLAK